jgi:NADH:ubiquinone oxidoreductase subunit F (NADH-binding)
VGFLPVRSGLAWPRRLGVDVSGVQRGRGGAGQFKDRAFLRANPYQLVEGVAIAAFAIGAVEAFICLKASFLRDIEAVTRAVREFQTAGLCGD